MKIKQIAFILLGLFFLFQSCTIEKRLHHKGYYVEWKKFHPKEKSTVETSNLISKKENLANYDTPQEVEIEEERVAILEDAINEEQFQNPSENKSDNQSFEATTNNPKVQIENKKHSNSNIKHVAKIIKKDKEKDDGKETNKLAFISLSLALASFLLFFTVIPALFVSAVAIRQMKAEPNRYSNKSAALFAYIFSLIVIGLTAILIGALILAFGSATFLSSMYVLAVFLGLLVGTQVIINA